MCRSRWPARCTSPTADLENQVEADLTPLVSLNGLVLSVSTYEATDPGSILSAAIFPGYASSTLKAVAAILALKYSGCEIQLKA